MLGEQEATALSEVGAGTPVGELLRRYWMPIAAVSELDDRPVRPVRLMGEDLVLYRDGRGGHGLVERFCPHRRFDLSYAVTEERGLRCSHHGWLFDESGRCLERPLRDLVVGAETSGDQVRTKAYPVQSKGGLLWAYLGPDPAPLIPDWAGFHSPGYTVTAFLDVPCHWLQIMEGFHDPVHVEWLHDRWSYRLNDREVPELRPRHTAYRWLDFEHGVVYQRKLEGSDDWQADRTVVFPNVDGAGGQGWYLTWVVPVDETHSLLAYRLTITSWKTPLGQVMVPPRRGADRAREQAHVPSYRTSASLDPEVGPGEDFRSYLISQDYASWLGPGPLTDRTREQLDETDRGIVAFRRRLLEQAGIVAAGGDPQGVLRDPESNRLITLPGARRNYGLHGEGLPGMTGDDDVMFRAFLPYPVPQHVKAEVAEHMTALVAGLRPDWWKRGAAAPGARIDSLDTAGKDGPA